MTDSSVRRARALGVSALVVVVAALLTGPAAAAVPRTVAAASASECPAPTSTPASTPQAGGAGIDMTAIVIGPTPAPCSASVGSGGGAPIGNAVGGFSGGVRGSSSDGNGASGSVATTPDALGPAADEVDLGGVLNVGGLSSAYVPSLNPLGGDLQLWFTVRNVSSSTVDATADFWMEGLFGNDVSRVPDVVIADLKPGEMRTVSAELPGVGQWTILTAHVTFQPPEVLDGIELTSLTRDTTAFALPWLIVLLAATALGTCAIVQILRRREIVAPVGAPA